MRGKSGASEDDVAEDVFVLTGTSEICADWKPRGGSKSNERQVSSASYELVRRGFDEPELIQA